MKTGLIFFIFIALSSIVLAEEAPKYNFGSAQASEDLTVTPGEEVSTKLFFYNIFGNRITHISLTLENAPSNWDVSIEPEQHDTTVSISGVATTINENLYVEPSKAVEEAPKDVPEGFEYISSSVGFIGAKPAIITIKVPEDEKLGTSATVTISAIAEWLGKTGGIVFNQGRTFNYKVTVLSEEFTEVILEKAPEKEEEEEIMEVPKEAPEEEEQAEAPAPKVIEKEVKVGVSTSTFVGVVTVLIIIIIFTYVFMKKE